MNKILVVEDDTTIRECIRDFLTDKSYLVDTVDDGARAIDVIKKSPPDLVILDLGLPKVSGESVCKEVKKMYPRLPVIILTARNHTSEVIHGFQLGADDYMSKPFELEELLARVKAKLKDTDQEVLQIADLKLNTKSLEITRKDKPIILSPHEFKLLQYLMMNKGTVLTREMILNRIWQYSYDVDSRVVDVYIGYLRKKIDAGFEKKLINSVRGFGYVIKE